MAKYYDIGIQTLWNIPNYGTFIQAYALQKVIEKMSKRETLQIAHLDTKHFNFYYNYRKYLRSKGIFSKSYIKSFFQKNVDVSEKQNLFEKAYNVIPHTEQIDEKNVNEFSFQKIILGSDIIWDYQIEPFNCDKFLFGYPFDSEINSYAASFGSVNLCDDCPQYVVEAVNRMKNISVRDEKSAKYIEKIVGYKPPIVLDPTWLWNFNNDINVVEPDDEKYILVYGQNFSDEFIDNLISFSKEKGMKIIALDCNSDRYNWCDKMIKQSELDPFLWVGYFKNASYIATSTFHGLTFSLIFEKKFAFSRTEFILAKAETFLNELGILSKFTNNDVKSMLESEWNYEKIRKIIDEKKNESLSYLDRVLGD